MTVIHFSWQGTSVIGACLASINNLQSACRSLHGSMSPIRDKIVPTKQRLGEAHRNASGREDRSLPCTEPLKQGRTD
jgi:hypothetical protein